MKASNTPRTKYVTKGGGNAIFGLGFIGAVVFYLQQAGSFWSGVLGILKALVWPAFLVHDVLRFIR